MELLEPLQPTGRHQREDQAVDARLAQLPHTRGALLGRAGNRQLRDQLVVDGARRWAARVDRCSP